MVEATLTLGDKVVATITSPQPVPKWKSILMRSMPYGTDFIGAKFDIRKVA